jgi:hypothetical protein
MTAAATERLELGKHDTFGRHVMTSGYISENGEPGLDQILQALRAAVKENPRLSETV